MKKSTLLSLNAGLYVQTDADVISCYVQLPMMHLTELKAIVGLGTGFTLYLTHLWMT